MSDQTSVVCRCEQVETAVAREAIADGARTINDIKRRTRAGMGQCQGAYCVGNLARLLHEVTGTPFDRIAPMTARPPVRPIALDQLADLT